MTVIHPNPTGGTDWEGNNQCDDRMGQAFLGGGGILDSISVVFGNDEGASCDGSYAIRVYRAAGTPANPVPDAWQASTLYAVDDVVRPGSTANGDVHFLFVCTSGGTSGVTEPTWPGGTGVPWQSVSEGTEVADGTITWEVVYPLYPLDMTDPQNPAMPADDADTPTPGWLAESTEYSYNPGADDAAAVRTCSFTGDNRIRLEKDQWYMAVIQWRANSGIYANTIAQRTASLASATLAGSCYLDGFSDTNNGPRLIDDGYIKVNEYFELLDKVSGTDAGFLNTVTGGDTDPFNAGEKISFTVQSGDELDDGVTYYWHARAKDPSGSDTWSDWTTTRSFDAIASGSGLPIPVAMNHRQEQGMS